MPYDEDLANRIRQQLDDEFDVMEKRVFGSLGFMVRGHLCVAASRDGGLIVRTDPIDEEANLALPHVSPLAAGPRQMPGWIVVAAEGVADDADLARWIGTALDFVDTLPPKS